MKLRSSALVGLLAATACTEETDAKWMPPAVTKAKEALSPSKPVTLAQTLVIAVVVDSDPVVTHLPKIVAADAAATRFGVEVDSERWSSARSGQEVRVSFLRAADRAGLAAYIGDLLQRHPQLRPAEGHGFSYEEIPDSSGSAGGWRTHLVDRSRAISVRQLESLEIRPDPQFSSRLELMFVPDDAAAFSDLTEDHVDHKLAIIVGDRVVSAPLVREPIVGGQATITSGMSNAKASLREVQRLKAELLGQRDGE